ncbi:MAG: Asp-tRNA(Asn)/Glu-tRNA(Gln) amidotransferase subunit GatB [Ignavibacteria bacterium]|nr:Asp-tRNA(Asn)/Glu-tRNA(Gln) amidotransferase subunit GatB [Ignavibacteria bacterium]
MKNEYESVIGLEIHAQLLTESKLFCGCSTKFGDAPNTNICPVCLGNPGVLPVLNKKAVEFAIRMGLATNCDIAERSVFARKNYFYPDLPKGYQISQFEYPLCLKGFLEIETPNEGLKKIGITRIHLEEDAGKSIHDMGSETLIDVNRCGVPLIEIVTEPDIRSPREAAIFLMKIRQILRYLEICDGNMEEGSMRCDANVSVRLKGETRLGTKTEVKNMNSFKNVERALEYEIQRQIDLIENGGTVIQQTLLWNVDKQIVEPMRSKEESHDYRYFPEPDLPILNVNQEWIKNIKSTLPELPDAKKSRFISQFSLPVYDSEVLTSEKDVAEYFEKVAQFTIDYKSASNWIMTEVLKVLNEDKLSINQLPIKPEWLGELIELVNSGKISNKIAKDVFAEMIKTPKNPLSIVEEKNWIQVSDTSAIEKVIDEVLENNGLQVQQYLDGKEKVFGFFVGEVMKRTKGKANPSVVNQILKSKLETLKNKS